MSNSAVRKMEAEAERGGYRALIKEMNQLTMGKNEKAKAEAKPKKAKPKESEKKPDKKAEAGEKESPEVTDELRDMIRGFFHKKKNQKEVEPKSLYVGKGRKRPTVKKKRRRPGQPRN
jgi:hypothetical protein